MTYYTSYSILLVVHLNYKSSPLFSSPFTLQKVENPVANPVENPAATSLATENVLVSANSTAMMPPAADTRPRNATGLVEAIGEPKATRRPQPSTISTSQGMVLPMPKPTKRRKSQKNSSSPSKNTRRSRQRSAPPSTSNTPPPRLTTPSSRA